MPKVSGGKKLEAALKRIAANKGGTLKVGFLEGTKYPDGTPLALVAYLNEYGRIVRVKNPGPAGSEKGGDYYQLPRPYFRTMIAENSSGWPKGISVQLKANNYDAEKTLKIVGEVLVGQLKESINTLVSPPLAPSTIAAKGFDKPLIHTSFMVKHPEYEVVMK